MIMRFCLRLSAMVLPLVATTVLAANPDTGPGCGLGKLAWGDYQHQKSIGPQVMMATTNGTFGSQTFGISFGTSGCTNDGTIFAQEKVNVFVAVNFENLSQEMAKGSGEHLASLAQLMNVPEEHRSEFYGLAKVNYATLVQAGETTPVGLIQGLTSAMASNPTFARLVSH